MGHGSSLRKRHALLLCLFLFCVIISGTNATKYVWKTGLWMECQHYECGKGGTQFRSVFCGEMGEYNYNEADESKCRHMDKPKNMQKCFKVCDEHQGQLRWAVSVWSDCVLDPEYRDCSIRNGIRYRNVSCVWRTNGFVEDDGVCAEFKPKPKTEEHCDLKCPQDCVVSLFGNWKDCDTCLTVNKTRTRELIIPPANGGLSCPDFTEMIPCNNCSQTYTYQIGPWDVCSPVDEFTRKRENIHPLLGFQKRNIHCINSHGSTVGYKNCLDVLRSSTTELVNRQTCIIPQDCVVSEWSLMSPLNTSCYRRDGRRQPGFMIRTRSIITIPLGSGKPCPNLVHYFEVQQSEEKPCPSTTVFTTTTASNLIKPTYWKMSSWRECEAPPGGFPCTAGLQTRSAICVQQDEDGKEKPLADKYCSMKRPLTSQICRAECDLDCTVSQWTQWSECKVTDCELYLRRKRTNEGTGQRHRTRSVLTEAQGQGMRCLHLSETQTCDPQPCYNWNMTVGPCRLLNPNTSPPCGLGIAYRTLACVNKIGVRVSDSKCEELGELPSNQEDCNIPCSHDCILSTWSSWSQCPNMCQEGNSRAPIQKRERNILAQNGRGGADCPPNRQLSEVRPCPTTIECAVYVWQTEPWGTCLVNDAGAECGPGTQKRDVSCYSLQGQLVTDQRCTFTVKPGTNQPCEVPCPVDCEVTDYSDWSPCSASCWEAKQTVPVQTKVRYIIQYPKHGGSHCPNKLTEVKQCTNLTLCQGFYWDTSPWSPCVLPLHKIPQCGAGLQARDVSCRSENGTVQLLDVCIQHIGPIPEMSKPCYKSCDAECVFEEWSQWSQCITGCSVDEHVPTNPKCRDRRLYPVDAFEKCLCDSHKPVSIGNWSECILETDGGFYKSPRSFPVYTPLGEVPFETVTPRVSASMGTNALCGQGHVYKVYACQNEKGEVEAANQCSLKPYEEDVCLIRCPVDCVMSDWSHWTDCSTSCGTGTQMRYRHIKQMPSDGGRECPSLDNARKETQTRICTIDCLLHRWREYKWSPCMPIRHDSQCGNGSQSRIVRCEVLSAVGYTNEDVYDTLCLGFVKPRDQRTCYAPCVGECVVSEWQLWSRCKQPCSDPNQVQSRTRNILRNPGVNRRNNCPNLLEERFCIKGDNCVEYRWRMSEWTSCLVNNGLDECGVGHKERYPICRDQTNAVVKPARCIEAVGESTELLAVSCQIPCDIDCLLTEWSPWSECSNTCGIGKRLRERDIVQQPRGNGRLCPSIYHQTKPCFERGCYTWVVSPWSPCSYQVGVCGHGIQTRNVTCVANGGLPVNESNCAPDMDIIVLEKERPCSIPCPGECVMSEWTEWNDCFIDCKHFERSRYTHGVQSRSRAVLAYAQLNNLVCPDQLWDSRPCEADKCFSFHWKVSAWSMDQTREVWCERSDDLPVTGGCQNHSRPAITLMCNPPCKLAFSYCNDTNYCRCQDKYVPVFNSLNVLVDCKMENTTLTNPSSKTVVTLPTDGPTNVWMYAVITAGTLFVIFLAVACYTMSEFFHKGPRPRKKDEEKANEGAEPVDGMVAETEFVSYNHVPHVDIVSGDVDRHSIVSADRTPPQSVRARECSTHHNTSSFSMRKNVLRCFSVFTSRFFPQKDPPGGVVTYHLSSAVHENNLDVVDRVHAPLQNDNDHYMYELHEDLGACGNQRDFNLTEADAASHETRVLFNPRYASTINTKPAPLYAHVDKKNTVISSIRDVHANPVNKPSRAVDDTERKSVDAVRTETYKAFSQIDSDSGVLLSKTGVNCIGNKSRDTIDGSVVANPASDIVYLNREESDPELNQSHELDDINSNSLKDILQTYFDKISGEESANGTVDIAKLNSSNYNKDVDEVFTASPENEPFLNKNILLLRTEYAPEHRRPSLIEVKSQSLDQPTGCNHKVTHIYDTEDDNLSRTMSLRSQGSVRSRLSNLSISRGPSIQINPEECDINQNKLSKDGRSSRIPNKSQTWSAPYGNRNRNIAFVKCSSFDTETSTVPSTSVSFESLSSPRSLHSESPSENSVGDNFKVKGQGQDNSGRNVAIDSLKQRNCKTKNLGPDIEEDFDVDNGIYGGDHSFPQLCVPEYGTNRHNGQVVDNWKETSFNGHANGERQECESSGLLSPSHFSDKISRKQYQ